MYGRDHADVIVRNGRIPEGHENPTISLPTMLVKLVQKLYVIQLRLPSTLISQSFVYCRQLRIIERVAEHNMYMRLSSLSAPFDNAQSWDDI